MEIITTQPNRAIIFTTFYRSPAPNGVTVSSKHYYH